MKWRFWKDEVLVSEKGNAALERTYVDWLGGYPHLCMKVRDDIRYVKMEKDGKVEGGQFTWRPLSRRMFGYYDGGMARPL